MMPGENSSEKAAPIGRATSPDWDTNQRLTSMKVSPILQAASAILFMIPVVGPKPVSAAPGDLIDSFDAGLSSSAHTAALQPDGKILVGGSHFLVGSGSPGELLRPFLARINPDGSPDASFYPSPNNRVTCIAFLDDGRILISGWFTSLQPGGNNPPTNPVFSRNYLAMLHPNGTVDESFNASGTMVNEEVHCMFPLPDGRILLGGKFSQVNGQPRSRIAMINADGSLADGFTCSVGGARVQTISRDSQGRFILGSESLSSVNGITRSYLARLNPDGSLDETFNPSNGGWVYSTAVLPDDSILVGGEFTTIGGGNAARFAKLDPDGNLAPGFVPPNPDSRVYGITPLTDGSILISGSFSNLHPTGDPGPLNPAIGRLARVLEDGTLDLTFSPNPTSSAQTHALISESGRLFLAGNFNTVKTQTRIGLAEIENRFTNSSLWVDENGRIEWIRSGALAEPTHVTFDVSTDGGVTWNPLGEGSRILGTSGWELAGSGLPDSGKIRARARFTYGYEGSSSLAESISDYVLPTIVFGEANLWLSGQPDGTPAEVDDLAPDQSPVLAPVTLIPGNHLIFSVTGGTHNGPIPPIDGTSGPDGIDPVTHNPENHLAGLTAPLNSLVGVFLSGGVPETTFGDPLPTALDFTEESSRDYATLEPELKQPFFIGDGRDAATTVQHVRIPIGASRLFLGSLDVFTNRENYGSFTVSVDQVTLDSLPEPTEFEILSGSVDEAWRFTANFGSTVSGLSLRVQSASSPGGPWTDLPDGGEMTPGVDDSWSFEIPDLPYGTRYFRVVASAPGRASSLVQHPDPFIITSPAGRILYTRGYFGSSELVLMESDGSGKTSLTDSSVAPLRAALSPDGGTVAFTTPGGQLFVMRAEPMNAITNPPVNVLDASGVSVQLFAVPSWSPDGRFLAFSDDASHIRAIEAVDENGNPRPFDATNNPVVDVYTSLSGGPNIAWSPDGQHLAVTDGSVITAVPVVDGGGSLAPANPSEVVTLTNINDIGTQKISVAWSPAGTEIAFVESDLLNAQTRVVLLTIRSGAGGAFLPENSAGNSREPLSGFGDVAAPQTVSWSPDGTLLALEVMENSARRIDVIMPDPIHPGTNPAQPLTEPTAEGDAYQPCFQQPSGDGESGTLLTFEAAGYAGNEDDEFPISIRVIRGGNSSGSLSVPFSVTGGTATLDIDYTLPSSPLEFGDGETEKVIAMTPRPDAEDDEGDETVLLELGTPSSGGLGGLTTTTVTIADSDSNQLPFAPPANSLTVALNGKTAKSGKGRSGDVFKFTARQEQGWNLPGLEVKVQYTTTPRDPGSWLNLPEPLMSRSTPTSLTWVHETRQFPTGKIFFRTRTYAIGRRSNAGPVSGPFHISPAPVLELTMDVDTDSDASGLTVKPGEFITYRIKCTNIGSARARKVTLNSRLPQATRFDSASHDNASSPGYFKRILDRRGVLTDVQWKVGDLDPGSTVEEFLVVQVDQAELIEYNRIIQNDRLTYRIGTGREVFMPIFRTTVSPPIRISIAKDKSSVQAGDLITYTLTIVNDASFTVTGGRVTDQLPLGTRLASTAHGDGTGNYLGIPVTPDTLLETPNGLLDPGFVPHSGMLTWEVGDIESGGSRQLRFSVRVAYDLFEKLQRNGESFDVQIQNLNFDFTGTPPSGGLLSAWGGVIPGSAIARTFVSAETQANRPEMGLQKTAMSDTWTKLGSADIAAVFHDGQRVIDYELAAWNYGTVAATETVLFDGIPWETELTGDLPLVPDGDEASVSAQNPVSILTTELPHGLTPGNRVTLPSLQGGQGLDSVTIYFVRTVPSSTEFTVAKTAAGNPLNRTTAITGGHLGRTVYDADTFMSQFRLNGTPLTSSAGFTFYDAKGSELSPGGEPFIDRNGNGRIDVAKGIRPDEVVDAFWSGRTELLDENRNGRYDGPGAIRTFSYRLGTLPPMTSPATRTLTYRVRLAQKVKSGEYIAGLNSAVHKLGQGLQLNCPDFYYPVIGSPPIEFSQVVSRVRFAMDRPVPRDNGFSDGIGGNLQNTYDITFTNTGSFYAVDTKLRIPIPPGFTTPSVPSLEKRNKSLDVNLPGSPGTAVFDIGEVAPGETVTRQLDLHMTSPIPASLRSRNGLLKNYHAPLFPHATATLASNASSSGFSGSGQSGQRQLLSRSGDRLVFTMKADGTSAITSPIQETPEATRVFIGRLCDTSVQEGGDFEIFLFFGNLGDTLSGPGEVGMQVPYGTRLVSVDPLAANPTEENPSASSPFPRGYFTIEQIKGKRRPEDGSVDVVRWKFANIPPSAVYCVKMRVAVNRPFPQTSIVDRSAYISVNNAAARSASPLFVKVNKDAGNGVDWWQGVGDLVQGFGIWLDDNLRNVLGNHTRQITLDSQIVSLGGADLVQTENGTVVIPLGRGRSAIIGRHDALSGNVPVESFLLYGEGSSLAMAAGTTPNQQVFVGGSIQGFRSVHTLLDQLADPVNSIVAAGGGNIVAAGGGNIVAAGGGNIVAGGGGNVVSNDGAGLAPIGSIVFANPPAIVAGGGGNIVAAGGGNIVAGGGGNIVAAGGGNIVAAGGGNIVAAGGGNIVEIGGRLFEPSRMSQLINSLIGLDGASLTDAVLLKQIGANVVANDGAGVALDPDALVGQDAASLIGSDAASLIGNDGGG